MSTRLGPVGRRGLITAVLAVAAAVAPGRPLAVDLAQSPADLRPVIESLVKSTVPGASPLERQDLTTLYTAAGFSPVWLSPAGRLTQDAETALALIDEAETHGLEAADYGATGIRALGRALTAPPPEGPSAAARFDVSLSVAVLRLFRHLHLGRVDPRTLGFQIEGPPHVHDFTEMLRTAVAGHTVRETAASLVTPLAQYDHLRNALGRYRALAATGAPRPPATGTATVRPGEPYGQLDELAAWLTALGDLDAPGPGPGPGLYVEPLVSAVMRFQRRHGLDPDGVLGRRTQAALAVPIEGRIRQLELALERLRWLPDLGDSPLIAVNIPMFRLWAWDAPGRQPALTADVVVGRAADTSTPVFLAEMTEVIFRPYWNVPRSIARDELVPAFRRQPDRFNAERFEIVRVDGSRPVPPTNAALADVERGALRLRQRPGATNALGLVKFVFPNTHDVYMHDTPATALFARSRRDFSHGCIRVEDPAALAEWVLADPSRWPRPEVVAAMQGADDRSVPLTRPVQVLLFYLTAAVMPEDGSVHFAEDIYGHDSGLDRALSRYQRRTRPVSTWTKFDAG